MSTLDALIFAFFFGLPACIGSLRFMGVLIYLAMGAIGLSLVAGLAFAVVMAHDANVARARTYAAELEREAEHTEEAKHVLQRVNKQFLSPTHTLDDADRVLYERWLAGDGVGSWQEFRRQEHAAGRYR